MPQHDHPPDQVEMLDSRVKQVESILSNIHKLMEIHTTKLFNTHLELTHIEKKPEIVNTITSSTKESKISYRDAVTQFPQKLTESVRVFSKPQKKKTTTYKSNTHRMSYKRQRVYNFNLSLSFYFDHDVDDNNVNRIIDIVGARAKVVAPANRRNVIQIFADNQEDFKSCTNDFTEKTFTSIYADDQDFIISPSNFQPSEHTLMFYTSSKTKHYEAIAKLLELIYGHDGINYEQFNTSFKDRIYKLRISFDNAIDKDRIKNLLKFEEFRTLEQIKNEMSDTIAECNFGMSFSENSIQKGVANLFKRAGLPFEDKMLKIVKQNNQRINTVFNICKIEFTTKEDLRKFVSLDGGFKTKDGHVVVKRFISSIDYITAKIAKNNQRYPYNISNKPILIGSQSSIGKLPQQDMKAMQVEPQPTQPLQAQSQTVQIVQPQPQTIQVVQPQPQIIPDYQIQRINAMEIRLLNVESMLVYIANKLGYSQELNQNQNQNQNQNIVNNPEGDQDGDSKMGIPIIQQ